MLLVLVVILILIWSAVVWSLYSNFLVFYENFSETENYHKARYASIAATERAELVIRQRQPWFVWSWWWKAWTSPIETSSPSDKIITGFSYLSNTEGTRNTSTLFRNINSRATRIPAIWKWNVDKLLLTGDSQDYNIMDYDNSEILLLYYDNPSSTTNPYSKTTAGDLQKSNIEEIDLSIRLPWFISNKFGPLNTSESLTSEGKPDDPIVDWQLKGILWTSPFTIFATQRYDTPADSAIREGDINQNREIKFNDDQWNPIVTRNDIYDTVTIISPIDDDIKGYENHFKSLFSSSTQTQLKLSLLNLVKWTNGSWMIYPFLEYYVEFKPNNIEVSDRYYTIETEWNFWDYQINRFIFRPTITESILKSFTTIL